MSTWILGEFKSPEKLLEAVRRLREAGHKGLDTYSPYPLHGAEEAMGLKKSVVPLIALTGGMTGVATAFVMQYYPSAVDYPINVANRLAFSPPAFVPIMFELGILLTGLSIFGGLIALFGFPRPHHPVFEVEAFRSASTHAFWVSVETAEPEKDVSRVEDVLRSHGASHVAVHKEPEE